VGDVVTFARIAVEFEPGAPDGLRGIELEDALRVAEEESFARFRFEPERVYCLEEC
jgi:hypothetical protein